MTGGWNDDYPPTFLRWLEDRMTRPQAEWSDVDLTAPIHIELHTSDMAEYVDPDGRTVSIDERYFMEWVELGFQKIRERLNAEDRMDDIDKRKQEGGE